MTKLFGMPVGTLAAVLSITLVRRAGRRGDARAAQPGAPAPGRAQRPPPSRAQRADRRRVDARHGDHRGGAGHRRQHEPDDPLVGDRRARPHRRGRRRSRLLGVRRRRASPPMPRAPPAPGTSRRRYADRIAARGPRLRPGRRRDAGDHRGRCRPGRHAPPERAPRDAVRGRPGTHGRASDRCDPAAPPCRSRSYARARST